MAGGVQRCPCLIVIVIDLRSGSPCGRGGGARGLWHWREQLQRVRLASPALRYRVHQLLQVHAHARRAELPDRAEAAASSSHSAGNQCFLPGVKGGPESLSQAAPGRWTSLRSAVGAGRARGARACPSACANTGSPASPTPTLKAPSSPAGYSAIEDRGGVILAIPSTINVQSPAFQQAAKACQFS